MATIPQHVKIARSKGALAGVENLHETLDRNTNGGTNGLETAQHMLSDIRKAGKFSKRNGTFKKPEGAVAWYCNYFGDKGLIPQDLPAVIEPRQTRTRTTRKAAAPAPQAAMDTGVEMETLVSMLAAKLGIDLDTGDTEDTDDEYEDDTEVVQGVPTRRVNRQAPATEETQAYPPPRDPDAPATQGKLWKLNAEGPGNGIFLCVIDEEGNILAGGEEPLTAGECYDLIGEHIAVG